MPQLPKTAKDALDLWDAGESLQAFHVHTDGADQQEIYAAAFEIIRHVQGVHDNASELGQLPRDLKLTEKEHGVAVSLAILAVEKGWAALVEQYDHPQIRGIQIAKGK